MEIDSNGDIFAIEREVVNGSYVAFVHQNDGTDWVQLGGALNTSASESNISSANIAVNSLDEIFTVLIEYEPATGESAGGNHVIVLKWNGGSWEQVGEDVFVIGSQVVGPNIAFDNLDRPVVSFGYRKAFHNYFMKIFRLNGIGWEQLGDERPIDRDDNRSRKSLVINSVGNPVVAYINDDNVVIDKWKGNRWVQLGNYPNARDRVQHVEMAIGDTGRIFVSTHETSFSLPQSVRVSEWRSGAWHTLGGKVNFAGNAWGTSIDVRGKMVPVISWTNYNTRYSYVSQYVRSTDSWIVVQGRTYGRLLGGSDTQVIFINGKYFVRMEPVGGVTKIRTTP